MEEELADDLEEILEETEVLEEILEENEAAATVLEETDEDAVEPTLEEEVDVSDDFESWDYGDAYDPDAEEDWSYNWEDDFVPLDDDYLIDEDANPWDSFAYNDDP